MITALLLALAPSAATVTAVSLEPAEGRTAVRIAAAGRPEPLEVARDSADLVVRLNARLGTGVFAPAPSGHVRSVALEPAGTRLYVRIRLSSARTPFEIRRDAAGLVVLVGQPPSAGPMYALREAPPSSPAPGTAPPSPSAPDEAPGEAPAPAPVRPAEEVRGLYERILPPPLPLADTAAAPPSDAERAVRGDDEQGVFFGRFRFRPAVVFSYANADTALLETAEPVHDEYFQVEPRLGLGAGLEGDLDVAGFRLQLGYEPRFRASSSLSVLRRPTHFANATLTAPASLLVLLRARYAFSSGVLETTEVDPGREYFFDLGKFTRHHAQAMARFNPEGRLQLELTGGWSEVNLEDSATFFDHEKIAAGGELRYGLAPDTHAFLRYAWEEIPEPFERPLVAQRSHTGWLGFEGELIPLVRGQLAAGYRLVDAPRAAEGGRAFSGFAFTGRLTKDFTPTSTLSLVAARLTHPSAFEGNAFYLEERVGPEANVELGMRVVLRGAATWHRNSYETPSFSTGQPRRDRIFRWSVGLGRPLTRWGFLRADYQRERRTSTLPAFDTRSNAFLAQIGIGYYQEDDFR